MDCRVTLNLDKKALAFLKENRVSIDEALNLVLSAKTLQKYIENKTIEIIPFAYMRGRNIRNRVVAVSDENQNTNYLQMKTLLTRLCWGGKIILTGDLTQCDLPKHVESGLKVTTDVLRDTEGIAFVEFNESHNMRHKLVNEVIRKMNKNN